MTENTQATKEETVVTEPSLDDVIAEYKPQPVVQQQSVQQPAVQQPTVTSAPTVDPLDEKSFGTYVEQVNNGQSVLNNQLQDVRTELTQLREDSAKLQIETDINDAVSRINDGLNLDPKRS